MKTYVKKFDAQRAARVELGDDAIEGIDYRSVKTSAGWTWEQGRRPAFAEPERNADDAPTGEPDSVLISDLKPETDPAAAANAASWNSISAIKRAGKRNAIEECARNGKLPEPPDFSAETHKRFRNKLTRLVEMAKASDVTGLKAIEINPVSSSPKAMARYRDLAIIALEARRP
ncbi:MAG: hypothetical protein HYX36_00575 [Rhizobiales bacterium]|nr:hypothetical protein [Hyphomicrobiales bacterium]